LLDLNQAADALGVAKRRMYDITAVLEGVGVIEKRGVNSIQWRGADPREQSRSIALQAELAALIEQETTLDEMIAQIQQHIESMVSPQNPDSEFIYVTEDDIKAVAEFSDRTVLAIKAPAGAQLDMLDPASAGAQTAADGTGAYNVYVQSKSGAIDVFLLNGMAAQGADAATAGSEGTGLKPEVKAEALGDVKPPQDTAALGPTVIVSPPASEGITVKNESHT